MVRQLAARGSKIEMKPGPPADSLSMNYDGKSSVIWTGSWAAVDKNITNFVTKFHDENGKQTHPETTPHNPWPN